MTVGLSISSSGIDTVGLVTIEHTHGLSHLSEYGATIDRGLDGLVIVGQGSHLILIVT